jgi:hypothetical protein
MKKKYLKPVLEAYKTSTECMLKTDSVGHIGPEDIGAKENNFAFDDEDFGDTWGVDSNNLWGDEE